MILVLASACDDSAAMFVRDLESRTPAALLTCTELAMSPISVQFPDFEASTITCGETRLAVGDISAVVNLLPALLPNELFCFPEAERRYQAGEIFAFLTFFFGELSCPVVNRPSAECLSGPYPSQLGWNHLAASLGIPVRSRTWCSNFDEARSSQTESLESMHVSCLYGTPICSDWRVDRQLIELAEAAQVGFLSATFADGDVPELLQVRPTPDVSCPMIRSALIDCFCGSGVRP